MYIDQINYIKYIKRKWKTCFNFICSCWDDLHIHSTEGWDRKLCETKFHFQCCSLILSSLLALLHLNGTCSLGAWFSIVQKSINHEVTCQDKRTLQFSSIANSIFQSWSIDALTDCPALSWSNTLVRPFLNLWYHFLTARTDIISEPYTAV